MKIITTTLNPAFDIHYKIKDFKPYRENYVDSTLVEAGGKGVNISRSLSKNGVNNLAYIILGEDNSENFISKIKQDGLNYSIIYCKGKIRENITIHSPGMPETRISKDGFSITENTVKNFLEKLIEEVDKETIVTFSGRIPRGLSIDYIMGFLKELRNKHCMLTIDCNSLSMENLIHLKPWLIKPNEHEVGALLGMKINTMHQAKRAAKEIHEMGIENVIISMGENGAAASLGGSTYILKAPKITPLSTIGAGDSLIAGFIGAFAQGFNKIECFRNGVAYGTASCLTKGTAPPEPEDIKKIKNMVYIEE